MPYSVAPWVEEENDPPRRPVIKVLRGDFFCMPFGGNATVFRGEKHPIQAACGNQAATLQSASGKQAKAKINLDFLQVGTT